VSWTERRLARRRSLGEDHVLTIVLTNNLAEVLRLRGDLDAAKTTDEHVVEAASRRRASFTP
jgi:hypothetical protein